MNEYLPHYTAAYNFLMRDPHANRELLLALRYEHVTALYVAQQGTTITGAAVRGPGPFNPNPDWLRLDALDDQAVQTLLRQVQHTSRLTVSAHRPWMDAVLADYGYTATGAGVIGYLVAADQIRLQSHPAARLLTAADRQLVVRSACGWSASYFDQLFLSGRQPWAIIQDGVIVCRASSGYPHADSEEVVGVWTHPRWRGRGLARQLVSAVAAAILEQASYAVYTTTFDNLASQAVARAVGFAPCFRAASLRRVIRDT